jgi:hypothetical protein
MPMVRDFQAAAWRCPDLQMGSSSRARQIAPFGKRSSGIIQQQLATMANNTIIITHRPEPKLDRI